MKCHSTRPVTMWYLQPPSRGRTLARGFGSQLLAQCFTKGQFAGSQYEPRTKLFTYPPSPSAGARQVGGGAGIRERQPNIVHFYN